MKNIKFLGLLIMVTIFSIGQAKATGPGANTLVIWPLKNTSGPNTLVIWPLVQGAAKSNSALMAVPAFSTDYSSGSNLDNISITNNKGFSYIVTQDNITTTVDYSNWPLGDYKGMVTFTNGDYSPITFTISK